MDLFGKSSNSATKDGLSATEFKEFRNFLETACGIYLAENKQYLVTTRVRRLLQEHGIESFSELISQLSRGSRSPIRQKVIDAMTTNETFWFRDIYPFEHFKNKLLPDIAQKNQFGSLRIWSAACSSGQEPYSISMCIEEFNKANPSKAQRSVEIMATDLSSRILDAAKAGQYDSMAVARGLSHERRDQFFDSVDANTWAVKSHIKNRVKFRSLNLIDSFNSMGKFDLIFCRNVLIYFNNELKTDILNRIHASLKPNGLLFLGSSESLAGAADKFEMIHCSPGIMYQAK